MSARGRSLSIVIAMLNEEESIAAAIEDARRFGERNLDDWEILVVDDGSTDRSAAVAERFAGEDGRVRVIGHATNEGIGAAIATGIGNASKEHFVFNAADGQVPMPEIGKLLPLLDRADIALSTYAGRREGPVRLALSRGLRAYMRLACGVRFEMEGLYVFPTRVARELLPLVRSRTFFFSFELIQHAVDRGLETATAEILCRPRRAGASKVANSRRILRVAADATAFGLSRRAPR